MRNTTVSSRPTSTTLAIRNSQRIVEFAAAPKTSDSAPRIVTVVIATTNAPDVTSRSRLLSRSATGLGRLLRGTDQATFRAFWSACPRPREP